MKYFWSGLPTGGQHSNLADPALLSPRAPAPHNTQFPDGHSLTRVCRAGQPHLCLAHQASTADKNHQLRPQPDLSSFTNSERRPSQMMLFFILRNIPFSTCWG